MLRDRRFWAAVATMFVAVVALKVFSGGVTAEWQAADQTVAAEAATNRAEDAAYQHSVELYEVDVTSRGGAQEPVVRPQPGDASAGPPPLSAEVYAEPVPEQVRLQQQLDEAEARQREELRRSIQASEDLAQYGPSIKKLDEGPPTFEEVRRKGKEVEAQMR